MSASEAQYLLRCVTCGAEYAGESAPEYVCPGCAAKQQAGRPLLGVLECVYDCDAWKRGRRREAAASDMLLPAAGGVHHGLRVGNTPLYPSQRLAALAGMQHVWVKDDTVEPTGSYKDRATALVIAMARARGCAALTCASTGNAAASLAGLCAAAGLRCHLFVPAGAPRAKLVQLAAYGATLFAISGTYDQCYELSIEATRRFGWHNRNTAYSPWTIEGKKAAAWEIAVQLGFTVPDHVVVPAGDGAILAGVWKGFADLKRLGWIERMPRLIAVQPSGADALAQAWRNGADGTAATREHAASIADSLVVAAPRNAVMALRALRETNGFCVTADETAIIGAIKEVSSATGVFVEPAAAAAWAGLLVARAAGLVRQADTAVLLLTGSGLKDIPAAARAVAEPSAIPASIEAVEARMRTAPGE
ncbi:threonine synthase [bacterium]|nr:threonine synthase [bacterium]